MGGTTHARTLPILCGSSLRGCHSGIQQGSRPEEKTWRHLDFFQHAAYLTARVLRCKCDEHGVKQVPMPWAREGSGFTLLLEAPVMTLVQAVPVARIVGERDTRIWRVLHHFVEEGRKAKDMAALTQIGVDETASRLWCRRPECTLSISTAYWRPMPSYARRWFLRLRRKRKASPVARCAGRRNGKVRPRVAAGCPGLSCC